MKSPSRFLLLPLCALLTHCAVATEGPGAPEDAIEGQQDLATVYDDDLNGLWLTTVDGQQESGVSVIESWPAVGIRLTERGTVHSLTRDGETLTGTLPAVSLAIQPNGYGVFDDKLAGSIDGHSIELARDTRNKAPITLKLPGDRPYRQFLAEQLVPLAQQDRESYTTFYGWKVAEFLKSCELYKTGAFQWKYMKGATLSEQSYNLLSIAYAMNYVKTTPRRLTKEKKFVDAVKANLKDETLAALAISTLSMYFSTGAGRSIRIPIGGDSMIYFITDRPSRAERIGLVAMKTPTHGPLASTFGRQLLDLGAMPPSDDPIYTRTLMEMLAKSDAARAGQLSGVGRSALTDWFAVMAIEDYRGVAFGWPTLSWGYNMTNVQFYGLLTRALARPGTTDSAGSPVIGQVLVGNQLRPGEASYADVLNHGNDMQEYPDMANLKRLATQYLREKRASHVAAVEAAFANVVPPAELGSNAKADIFHFITAQLYDSKGRTANLKGPAADVAIEAVSALFEVLRQDSAALESFILSKGYTKSQEPAPKSTGF